jgi:hypothetical protein
MTGFDGLLSVLHSQLLCELHGFLSFGGELVEIHGEIIFEIGLTKSNPAP